MSNKAAKGARLAQARPTNKAKNKTYMTEKARVQGRDLASLVSSGTSVPRHHNRPSYNMLHNALLKSGIKPSQPNNFKHQHLNRKPSEKCTGNKQIGVTRDSNRTSNSDQNSDTADQRNKIRTCTTAGTSKAIRGSRWQQS
jgi:hypothetical protein